MGNNEIIKEVEIEVYGRVQGVNLRYSIKKFCDALGIRGYVMNRKEGSVLIVAQGNEQKLDELILWVKESPGFSSVKKRDPCIEEKIRRQRR